MKKSQSLKERKFNIIMPKTSNPIQEKNENKNTSKIIIKTIADLPDLHLPIKKIPHLHMANKKHKNPKINPISLEKLKLMVLNLRMSKNAPNRLRLDKSYNKKFISSSPNKNIHYFKNNYIVLNSKKKKINNLSNKTLYNNSINEISYNYNLGNNSKKNNVSIHNTNETNINRSNSLEAEISQNSDLLPLRNKEKKWYNNIGYLTEKYNELIMTTENLEKNLLNKYLDGTDNIISEMEEPQFLKEDIEINTINVNASLRKHLSIRETTLDSSYHNSHNHTDKLKGKTKGYILRIKNYRKMFRKYRTNFTIKSIKEKNKYYKDSKILKNRKKNEYKRKKKLPFSKSLSKINNHNNNDVNNINNINKSNNEYINNNNNLSYDKDYKDPFYSFNEMKKKYNYDKDILNIDKRNTSLAIIKESNDNINIDNKDKNKDKNRDKNKDIENYCQKQVKIVYDSHKSKKKNKIRDNISKEKEKITHSSEKMLYNIKPKNSVLKNKKNLGYKNNNSMYFDEYLNEFKNNSKSSIDDYIISEDLGIGSYAQVKLGIHKKTKKKYAIKIYDKNILNDEEKKFTIKNEIFILKLLNNENDNIMKLYGVINTNKYLYLILEYINGISLLEYIQNKKIKRIKENVCKKIFYQIVKAILYCQNKNICHRDIKLENILIINEELIKIIDFGFAIKCNKNEYQEFYCGTIYYMPPEIVNKQKYIPFYSDIWSLGVLLYAMLFGNFPFKASKQEKLFELINEANLVFPKNIEVSDEVKNLLLKIIVIDPSKRLSLEDILNDPWFKI